MKAVGIDVGKAALDLAVRGDPAVRRFANTAAGIRRIRKELAGLGDVRIVVEATGGYEEALLDACTQDGLWIARVNPHQARSFAKALGQLAKTDALDAHVLAEMAHALHGRMRPHVPQAASVSSKGRCMEPDRSSTSMRFGLSCFAVIATEVVV